MVTTVNFCDRKLDLQSFSSWRFLPKEQIGVKYLQSYERTNHMLSSMTNQAHRPSWSKTGRHKIFNKMPLLYWLKLIHLWSKTEKPPAKVGLWELIYWKFRCGGEGLALLEKNIRLTLTEYTTDPSCNASVECNHFFSVEGSTKRR